MNTEQNYSGEAASPSPPEPTAQPLLPTAQNAAQPRPGFDERRKYFHRLAESPGATEYLETILDRLSEFVDVADPVPVLTELIRSYLTHPWCQPTPDRVQKVDMALRLIEFLSELRSEYACLVLESEGVEKEGQDHE